jgi:uncharacterized repeat protein (TIGR04076 family)
MATKTPVKKRAVATASRRRSAPARFELFDLRVTVEQAAGVPMICNHKAGDFFELRGENLSMPAGQTFPLYPLAALLPLLPAKQRDTHPHDWMTTDAVIACPDPHCGGRFRIERLGRSTFNHADVTAVPLVQTVPSSRSRAPRRAGG